MGAGDPVSEDGPTTRALVLIDVQDDHLPGGGHPLVGPEDAAAVTVVADACAAPDLEHAGTAVPGALVHAAFMAALGQGYADVTTTGRLLERPAAG